MIALFQLHTAPQHIHLMLHPHQAMAHVIISTIKWISKFKIEKLNNVKFYFSIFRYFQINHQSIIQPIALVSLPLNSSFELLEININGHFQFTQATIPVAIVRQIMMLQHPQRIQLQRTHLIHHQPPIPPQVNSTQFSPAKNEEFRFYFHFSRMHWHAYLFYIATSTSIAPPAPSTYPSPAPQATCGQNLLVSCQPSVSTAPCSSPPPPPPHPSYAAKPYWFIIFKYFSWIIASIHWLSSKCIWIILNKMNSVKSKIKHRILMYTHLFCRLCSHYCFPNPYTVRLLLWNGVKL